MKTYYLSFKVSPEKGNKDFELIAGAVAHFWIVDDKPESATSRARGFLTANLWKILEQEQPAAPTTEGQHLQKDIGLENYRLAQEQGMAVCFAAWTANDDDLIH